MRFEIRVEPAQHRFTAGDDETILAAALRQGIALPYSCRDGACGSCRGKVMAGSIDHGKSSDITLSVAERDAGFALFCCAKAQSDLVIECREARAAADLPVKTLPARIERMTRAAPDVMILELRLPASERLQFLAGQYVDILLKEGRRRAFSLANAPHDDALLQLHIRQVAEGRFTSHVFSGMKERDILRINGPHGHFHLREDSDKPILFVAGSTGFAPIKAIVEHAIALGTPDTLRPMHVYWGGRTRRDLYLLSLAENWAATHADIRFTPVLSEPDPADGWTGRTGLVHEAVMHEYPDLSGHHAYVCGSPAMVCAARRDFVAQCRLPDDAFFADAFTFNHQ